MIVARFLLIPGTQFLVYDSVAGFAADGVKRIAVIDLRDRVVPMAEVLGNVYSDGPADRVKGVAALDEAGKVIWRSAEVQLPEE
jgi:hypothetical protein